MKVNRSELYPPLLFLTVFFQLNLRPAILQTYTELIFISSVLLFALTAFVCRTFYIDRNKLVYIGISISFVVYLLVQSIFKIKYLDAVLIKNLIPIILSIVTVLLYTKNSWDITLKAIIYPVLFFSVSYLITLILALIFSSLETLEIANFTLYKADGTPQYEMVIYFPFSIAISFQPFLLDFRLARAVGYLREAGLFSILVTTVFFAIDFIHIKYKLFFKISLLITLILTFSTAGIGSFIICYIYYHFIAGEKNDNKIYYKLWSLLFIIPVIGYYMFGNSRFSLLSKLQQNSGQQRVSLISEGLGVIQEHPLFGVGYLNTEVSSMTFLSAIGLIGLFGTLIFVLMILVPNLSAFLKKQKRLVLIIPIVFTTFLAQPLFDKPIIYIFIGILATMPLKKNNLKCVLRKR